MADPHGWAVEEFGHSALGDMRRTRRLVEMAATVALRPGGKVTDVFRDAAAREAAFRLLENDAVDPGEVARSAHVATATRARGERFVWVPIDGSSLNVTDHAGTKGLGIVGARSIGASGLCVMSAIAVSPSGVPIGLCGQRFWARKKAARSKKSRDARKVGQKETRYWLDVMEQTRQVFGEHGAGTRPWFQLDRGGDAWPVLLAGAPTEHQWFTVRAVRNRRVRGGETEQRYLRSEVEAQPILGVYELDVPAAAGRAERTARFTVQWREVRLDLLDRRNDQKHEAVLHAVLVREQATVPSGEKPIEWLLLTNYPVESLEDAMLVVHGYSQRWRIEEFHKVWKTGACRVEETQLRAEDHVIRWATLLASVAMRILRLTYFARVTPNQPARIELSDAELKAILLLRKPARRKGKEPSIAEAVTWIAELGGYTGRSSGGPPGPLVIARGLVRIEPVAELLADGSLAPRSDQ